MTTYQVVKIGDFFAVRKKWRRYSLVVLNPVPERGREIEKMPHEPGYTMCLTYNLEDAMNAAKRLATIPPRQKVVVVAEYPSKEKHT